MGNETTPKEQAENAAWKFITRFVGKNLLMSLLTVAILIGWGLNIGGMSLKGWYYISEFFSERKSVLTGSELEVANEWVIYVDSGAEFIQVEARRQSLLSSASNIQDEDEPWSHFVRNLRVVRNPKQKDNWFLVADINSGQSSEALVSHTITCLKSKVNNWSQLDIFGSALEAAYVFPYRITEFTNTYGKPTNIKFVKYIESELKRGDEASVSCQHPYE